MTNIIGIPIQVVENALNAMASRDFNAIDQSWTEIRKIYDDYKAELSKVKEKTIPKPKPV